MEGLELWAGRINGTGTKKVDKKVENFVILQHVVFSVDIVFGSVLGKNLFVKP